MLFDDQTELSTAGLFLKNERSAPTLRNLKLVEVVESRHIIAYVGPYQEGKNPVDSTQKFLLSTEYWRFKDLRPCGKFLLFRAG